MSQPAKNAAPRRTLSLFDSVCIIVGTIIGSGIFKTAGLVADNAGSFWWMIGFWLFGGLLSLLGALCFAELTTRYRDEVGGDYVYLKKAYGRPLAFMFAWAAFWIIRPGNLGAMAMVFAVYFNEVIPTKSWIPETDIGGWDLSSSLIPYTLFAICSLTILNLIGMRSGKGAQNLLTVTKILGIGAVVIMGFLWGEHSGGEAEAEVISPKLASIWLGMVFVMFSFGGWNDIAFVSGEIKSPEKNLLRSLVLGICGVTLTYLLLNLAFVWALGFDGLANSQAIAQDAVEAVMGTESWMGRQSATLISLLVCISCLGAVNGMIITGPRIYYSVGRDYPPLRFLGEWSLQRDIPWQATTLQLVITMGMTLICLGHRDAFDVIVNVVAPYFWVFLGLVAFSLVIFRIRERRSLDKGGTEQIRDGFRTPLFPLEPLVLTGVCFGLCYAALSYVISENYAIPSIVVGIVMAIGVLLGFYFSYRYPESENNRHQQD